MPDSKDTYIKAVDGADVILTIDITVQALLESRLKEAYHDSNAQNRVTGVVTDPETGEILAMATYPSLISIIRISLMIFISKTCRQRANAGN